MGQNEDYSLETVLRNCSKEGDGGGGGGWGMQFSIHVILVKGESNMQSNTYFCRRLLLVIKNRLHHEGFKCFSRYREMQELGS